MIAKSQPNDIPAYRKYYKLYALAGLIAVASIVVIYSVFAYLYAQTRAIVLNESKSSLLTLTQTQALRFSPEDIDKVSTTTDIGTPSYVRLVSDLADIKKIAPKIAFAYIMKYNATATYPYIQIADADSMDPYANLDDRTDNDIDINKDGKIDPYGADELTPPGLPYTDAPTRELDQAHEHAHINNDFYTDTWGTFLGASAPIKRKDGSLAGIFALDMRDDDIKKLEDTVFRPFLITMIIIILSMLMLGFALVYIWQKKLKQILSFDRQKNIVIGMIAHELKNPLSAIRWILSSALEEKNISPEVTKKITQAYNVSVSAAEMSNTILDLSRIQLGKLDLIKEVCDLYELVASVQNEMQPLAESKGVVLNFENKHETDGVHENTHVHASPQYMKIAIKNLISNAIKYTNTGGTVTVSVHAPNTKVFFRVADTGVGISEEDQKNMYQKFSRAKSVSNIEGHGLGLYLTNNIALLHGGKLSFTSAVDKGTEFIMEIPQTQV